MDNWLDELNGEPGDSKREALLSTWFGKAVFVYGMETFRERLKPLEKDAEVGPAERLEDHRHPVVPELLDVGMTSRSRHEPHGNVAPHGPELLEDFNPRHLWHLVIEQDCVEPLGLEQGECLGATGDLVGRVAQ
jgi:hypothetical protein